MYRASSILIVAYLLVILQCLVNAETLSAAQPSLGRRVLVLADDLSVKQTHSILLDHLEASGFKVTVAMADEPTLQLKEHGEYAYDQLVLLSPSVEEFGGFVDARAILDFIDDGRSVFVAADSDLGEPVRELAAECGVDFDETLTSVIDHVNFDASDFDGDHTLVISDDVAKSSVVFGAKQPKRVLFRGIAQSVPHAGSSLHQVLARGASTSFSYVPNKYVDEEPLVAGRQTVLASALTARNNARVTFIGSVEMCSDAFFRADVQVHGAKAKAAKADNEVFCKQVLSWTFQQRGLLRASEPRHFLADAAVRAERSEYRINDSVTYEIDIEEYDGASDSWKPFKADDVQLEFIMLDPYVRQFLKHNNKGTYSLTFVLPDKYGVFTFRTVYQRPFYAHVESITRTPVRPYRHDEYERFIGSAYPYYTSAFSMMIGLFVFSAVFLFHKE